MDAERLTLPSYLLLKTRETSTGAIKRKQASQQDGLPGGGTNAGGWRDADVQKPGQPPKGKKKGEGKEDEEEEEEEDDPFGLGSIMSKADGEEEEEEQEEEEDPFGIGAIMEGTKKESDAPESRNSSKRGSGSSGGGGGDGDDGGSESRSKKAQKTTGGYFRGTRPATSAQSAVEEAKRQPFQAASGFGGARQGYVFQKGALGLGYYADKVQLRHAAAMAAATAAAASRANNRGTEVRGAGTPAAAGAAAAGRGRGERKPQAVDVEASLQKLKVFILKSKKATKAAALMADLMQAQMRPENARLFFRYCYGAQI